MWIFTDTGFVSAVLKPEHETTLTVRARDRRSLVELADLAGAKIAQSPKGDYPYRLFVEDAVFAQWVADQAMKITYSNFKSRVQKTRGYDYTHSLHNVWAAMLDTEDEEARTNSPVWVDSSQNVGEPN